MMTVDESLLYSLGYEKCRRLQSFKSKKNQVWLLEAHSLEGFVVPLVYKHYGQPSDPTRVQWEAHLLTVLKEKGVRVPSLYGEGMNCLVMEFIPGQNLCDYLLEQEKGTQDHRSMENTHKALRQLVLWLKGFYSATRDLTGKPVIMKDVNLRNFIMYQSWLYGIDFEDCEGGQKEEDAGKLLAYLMTYDPAGTQRRKMTVDTLKELMTKELGLDVIKVEKVMKGEVSDMEERRKTAYTHL